jgi:HEAT repeat protein
MGLFDFFQSPEQRIAKHTRRLTNRDSQPEDREASAKWLADEGSPSAIMGLLSRLDMNLDHDLKNRAEKDQVAALVEGLGNNAVEPVRAWIRQCKVVSLPLELLVRLQGAEAAVQAAFGVLQLEVERGNDFKPEKKKATLLWLAEHPHTDAIARIAPFLEDFDEGVRYAAIEALIAQAGDGAKAPLWQALGRAGEESGRLRARICDTFVQRAWPVLEPATSLPSGYEVRGERIVRVA